MFSNRTSIIPLSEKALTALVIFISPVKRIPKPMAIFPTLSALLNLKPINRTIPIIRAMGARVDGWKNLRKEPFSAFISISLII